MKTGLILGAIGLIAAASIGGRADPQRRSVSRGVSAPATTAATAAGRPRGHGPRISARPEILPDLSQRPVPSPTPRTRRNTPGVGEKVVLKLRGGMMPPQGMPRPDEATLEALRRRARADARRAGALGNPIPGTSRSTA